MNSLMYKLMIGIGLILPFRSGIAQKPPSAESKKSIFDYSYTSIDGKPVDLKQYKGRYILIVNVASKCGYTPQYEDLEKLYKAHKNKLVIVGFPANDFGKQEPGSNEDIATFCSLTYGVSFPMAEKTAVIGDNVHPIYKWLTDKSLNGWNEAAPKWNFFKYLIGKNGELLNVFPSKISPMSEQITSLLK
jgi:glutathione peroxidase